MKKFSKLFCVMIMSLLLVVPFLNVDAAKTTKKTTTTTTTASTFAKSEDEKAVSVYVFYLTTCPHCQELHEYLSELKEDKDIKDKFNVIDYEVSSSVNLEILNKVRAYFKDTGNGVPYFVIGDEDFTGFGESSKSEIRKTIEDFYGSKNYQDVVAAVINGTTDSLDDGSSNIIGVVVLGLCVVIIIALIICSSKNKYYEDDEEEEEEEKPAKAKATAKKKDTKAKSSKK